PVVGIGCTAALVSDRPKRGAHRCFIAAQTDTTTASYSLTLDKGARDREAEDRLVGQLILRALAEACNIDEIPPLPLRPDETVQVARESAATLLADVRSGRAPLAWSLPDGSFAMTLLPAPVGLLCG